MSGSEDDSDADWYDEASFYVGPANADGGQRVVRRAPERSTPETNEFALFPGDHHNAATGFGAAPKWSVIGDNTRTNIWDALWRLMRDEDGLTPAFKAAIKKWPTWVQARVSDDIMMHIVNYEDWGGWVGEPHLAVGEEPRMDDVSAIVETLHFAGFTTDIETIFNAHPITITGGLPNDIEKWNTVSAPHLPIRTQATFLVGPENATGGQRDVRRAPGDGYDYYGPGMDAFNGRAKWKVLGENGRKAIGQALWRLLGIPPSHGLAPAFGVAIKQWPKWLQDRIKSDVQKHRSALTRGSLSWSPVTTGILAPPLRFLGGMDNVSDIVETLHFAGFTTDIETIFNAHPILITHVPLPTNETEGWHTVRAPHHPIQTQATFANRASKTHANITSRPVVSMSNAQHLFLPRARARLAGGGARCQRRRPG